MENEYIRETIPGFGIEFQRPAWWQFRLEDPTPERPTYLFWDEYTGSLRITPWRPGDGFELEAFLDRRFAEAAAAGHEPEWQVFNGRRTLCYTEDGAASDTRVHYSLCGVRNTVVVCSFAYGLASLDDELSADEVGAALEEVSGVLDSMVVAPT